MTTEEYVEKYGITMDGFDIERVTTQKGSGPCFAHAFATLLNIYYETDQFNWEDYWTGSTTNIDYSLVASEMYLDKSEYLAEIRRYLDAGIPVEIVVNSDEDTHFVNAIEYVLNEDGEFTFEGIVITDSGTSTDAKVTTIGSAYTDYDFYEYKGEYGRYGFRIGRAHV